MSCTWKCFHWSWNEILNSNIRKLNALIFINIFIHRFPHQMKESGDYRICSVNRPCKWCPSYNESVVTNQETSLFLWVLEKSETETGSLKACDEFFEANVSNFNNTYAILPWHVHFALRHRKLKWNANLDNNVIMKTAEKC